MKGMSFNLTLPRGYLDIVDNPARQFTEINTVNAAQFVFVIASNSGYHLVAMDAVAIIQRLFPKHTIYYYDLGGISKDDIRKVNY